MACGYDPADGVVTEISRRFLGSQLVAKFTLFFENSDGFGESWYGLACERDGRTLSDGEAARVLAVSTKKITQIDGWRLTGPYRYRDTRPRRRGCPSRLHP